ncbi:hypothetical protein LIER_18346 [Lithospermum erythrorhizon]|uniref:Reverse transcriptase domain-containing protein n=1 Tax=Lithospermum erythrorhizon TaxID=34254 RepID=A0AAV3QEM9_LITER
MPHNKSCRPDGFPARFYQKNWSTVGDCLTKALLDFLNNGHLLKELNNTFIPLIPKFPLPKSTNDFRSISLCNASYKIASKVLVNRLKPHLNSFLSPYQNGFILGRGAQDNILMAQEITYTIRHSKSKKNDLVALKIDMIQYSVIINGQTTPPFKPTCNLRQGDPLSHILFALCTEPLSSSLLTHQAKKPLKDFCADSGQIINYHKSSITFSSATPSHSKLSILEAFNINCANTFGNYLVIHFDIATNRRDIFNNIVDKIKKRILGWKAKFLNFAGRITLIKSVLQSILVYHMGICTFPIATLNEIDKILANILWDGAHNTNIHWVNWDFLCTDKNSGNLSFKHLHHFNLVLLARNGWRLISHPHTPLSNLFKSKYYPTTTPLNPVTKNNPSWTWHSLHSGLEKINQHMTCIITNGSSTNIWNDKWVPSIYPGTPINYYNPEANPPIQTLFLNFSSVTISGTPPFLEISSLLTLWTKSLA